METLQECCQKSLVFIPPSRSFVVCNEFPKEVAGVSPLQTLHVRPGSSSDSWRQSASPERVFINVSFSASVEGESQCPETGSRKDTPFSQAPYLRSSERYTDSGGTAPSRPRETSCVTSSSSASLAWALRTRHQPASLALRKQEEEENKRCKALSDSYELSTDLQDKKVLWGSLEKGGK